MLRTRQAAVQAPQPSHSASFTWAMREAVTVSPGGILVTGFRGLPARPEDDGCPTCRRPWDHPEQVIEDEYGTLYTEAEFLAVLDECPIQYADSLGTYFS